jgi:hypothetical protein
VENLIGKNGVVYQGAVRKFAMFVRKFAMLLINFSPSACETDGRLSSLDTILVCKVVGIGYRI